MLVTYVSGHGFGHSTRVAEVLRAVRALDPALPLCVVSSAPERLYRAALPGRFNYRRLECDVGLVQRDSLVIDEAATLERWRRFEAGQSERVEREAGLLRESGARLVLGDVPPLAFAAAAAAGVPSVALANFSWDWIYRHLAARHPGFGEAAAAAAAAYARTDLLLQLPFAGDLGVFPRRQAIPLVARRPRLTRAAARERLGLSAGPVVLVSFGGIGLPGLSPSVFAALPAFRFLVTEGEGPLPGNVTRLARWELHGLGYEDVVAAADVVLTKPGYGIVTDAIAAGTRLVYTERGDFPEYPILVREMAAYLPCAHVSNQDLAAGRLGPALEEVLARPLHAPPPLDGAEVAAQAVLAHLAPRSTPPA